MHPLLSKMLARKDGQRTTAAPPPFDRTPDSFTVPGQRGDARHGENVPVLGSASAEGEFIVDVNYCDTATRHVYFRPEPHAALQYLGTVAAEDVDDLIEFVRAEQARGARLDAEYGETVKLVLGAVLLLLTGIALFAATGLVLTATTGNLGG